MLPTISKPTLLAAILFSAATAACAQQYTPPPPPLTAAPCKPTKKDPCTPPPADTRPANVVNPFPFPGDAPDLPGDAPVPVPAPARPAPQTPKAPANPTTPGAFPFPGEAPDLPADAPVPASATSNSSSSSSSSSSSGDTPIPDEQEEKGSTRFARKRLAKVEDVDTREAKDLEVSRYYVTTGNFLAAYLRAKDAVATIPDDPSAHFALADTAARLKKSDEAVAEYTVYLKLEPDGEKAPAARKALAQLQTPRK